MLMIFNKRGDTIVEVLIAIAVLSASLGAAFAISNLSVRKVQANHERYQAQLLINREAELLRKEYVSFVQNNPATGRSDFRTQRNVGAYCASSATVWVDITSGSCSDGFYSYLVTQLSNGFANGEAQGINALTYRIRIEWDSLVNAGKVDSMELVYGL